MTKTTDHITEIERTLTFQDQQIQDLSEMVNQQWKEIDRLKKLLNQTEERLDSLENPTEGSDIPHEIPPHY